ncbi:MAG: hypothetical protein P8K68_03100 [Algibacter sp.]|uniref:hypothetical protein n=1 Tax=Algibacter sp. TaxID=1872428 RepID=UPI002618F3C0|nr:hypothetical protein [Algibacter sp.]MDG1729974.1 hypothetical protein [Algibacter sp.]MDG2177758.1 hypothetical protein [Algibacter sp.]
MAKEYFIINSKSKNSQPNFSSFKNPLEIKSKINKVFTEEACKWTDSERILQGFYKSDTAHLRFEILKTNNNKNYTFQLTALDGNNPLSEISKLCKLCNWNAFSIENGEYLDLDSFVKTKISPEDKKKYTDDYWDKFNKAQEELENENYQENFEMEHNKKWWKFW